jgi:hypothetical protein
MQGNTSDIVRLWQSRIACQGPASAQVCKRLGAGGSGQMVGNHPTERCTTRVRYTLSPEPAAILRDLAAVAGVAHRSARAAHAFRGLKAWGRIEMTPFLLRQSEIHPC